MALFSAGSSHICHFVASVSNVKLTCLPGTHPPAVFPQDSVLGPLLSVMYTTPLGTPRQPRTNLSNSASPSYLSGIFSISSIDSPLSSSIAPSLFHSRLRTFLFCKSFPPQPTFSSSRLIPWIPQTVYQNF